MRLRDCSRRLCRDDGPGLLRRLLKRPIEKSLAVTGSLLMAVSMAALPYATTTGWLASRVRLASQCADCGGELVRRPGRAAPSDGR